MKNNILLILAVTIISIGIIVATVVISTAGGSESSSSESSSSRPVSSRQTTASTDDESTEIVSDTKEPTTEAETTPSTTESVAPVIIPDTSEAVVPSETADGIIATARSLIGIDFADSGDTPEYGFDNSGFVYYVLRENGYITCPRELTKQSQMGTVLGFEKLRPGDLAFFYAEDMTSLGFGGIYIGDGKMIACLMPGTQVKEIDITTSYYKRHFSKGVSIT